MLKMMNSPLTRQSIDEPLQAIVASLIDACQPQRVILFGSFATDTATSGSDIDLVVTFATEAERRAAPAAFTKRRPKINWALDIIWILDADFTRKAAVGGVCQIAEEDGLVLYRRGQL